MRKPISAVTTLRHSPVLPACRRLPELSSSRERGRKKRRVAATMRIRGHTKDVKYATVVSVRFHARVENAMGTKMDVLTMKLP